MEETGRFLKWAELILITVLLLTLFAEGKYKQVEIEILPDPSGEPARIFTAEELKKYDGTDSAHPILMGVRGVVFDVSTGKDFYGKGAAYGILAGKDATYAIAKWSLEEKDMHHDVSTLSDSDLKGLDEVYLGTYKKKYPVVGYMDYLMDQHAEKLEERFKPEL